MASIEDAAELAAIYAPYVQKTTISFEWVAPTEDEFRRRMSDIMGEYPYLVYEENGEILGYAYATEPLSGILTAFMPSFLSTSARTQGKRVSAHCFIGR